MVDGQTGGPASIGNWSPRGRHGGLEASPTGISPPELQGNTVPQEGGGGEGVMQRRVLPAVCHLKNPAEEPSAVPTGPSVASCQCPISTTLSLVIAGADCHLQKCV